MSLTTRYVKRHAKSRQRRRRTAAERLARDRRQAQHAAEALQQALDDLLNATFKTPLMVTILIKAEQCRHISSRRDTFHGCRTRDHLSPNR